ncbi:MAG: magnesium/cobalt transporter CorA [Geminicoccaceae bacterium]
MGKVIAAAAYRDGRKLQDIEIAQARQFAGEDDAFVWIGFYEPDEADLKALQRQFGLHDLAIEDALKAHQRPKVELYGETVFIALRTAWLEGGDIRFGETHIFAGHGYIISVRHGPSASYLPVRERCEATPALLRHGVDYVIYSILDFVVDNYGPVIESIRDEVDAIEDRIMARTLDQRDVRRIYQLRRELLRLRLTVAPTAEVCQRLQSRDLPSIDPELRPYFRDVSDHVHRVAEMVDAVREVLAFAFEASLLLESSRQSEITRRLAGWAAILAVPTAIAGIYGMNFEFMPELHWRYGYFAVIGVVVATCVILYWRFRKAGWI